MSLETVEKSHPSQPPPPSGFRQAVVGASKRYKNAWAELGKLLHQVREQALFEHWGFSDFYSYCKAELGIQRITADKLTRTYSFLDRNEPKLVKAPEFVSTAPAFEVVEVLAQAEQRGQLTADEYKSVRDSIWNNERPSAEVKKELLERFPPPEPPPPEGKAALRGILGMAKKLATEVHQNPDISKAIAERVDALVEDLEQELKNLKAKAKA